MYFLTYNLFPPAMKKLFSAEHEPSKKTTFKFISIITETGVAIPTIRIS